MRSRWTKLLGERFDATGKTICLAHLSCCLTLPCCRFLSKPAASRLWLVFLCRCMQGLTRSDAHVYCFSVAGIEKCRSNCACRWRVRNFGSLPSQITLTLSVAGAHLIRCSHVGGFEESLCVYSCASSWSLIVYSLLSLFDRLVDWLFDCFPDWLIDWFIDCVIMRVFE